VTVTDIDSDKLQRVAAELGATVVAPDVIHAVDCDVFSPCSIGAVVNDHTLPALRCLGIAGSANNVLAESRHADELMQRNILYAPDYLVNSGGLIRCESEVRGCVDETALRLRVAGIFDQTLEVFRIASEQSISPSVAADCLAEDRLARAR
jgi:leucine dehydrogenase